MSRHPPSLPMSHIIASDAPLLSPVAPSDTWDNSSLYSPADPFSHSYYIPPSPPNSVGSSISSPVPTARMLKTSISPDSASDPEQLCLPTHQVFDFPEVTHPPTPSSTAPPSPKPERLPISISPATLPVAAKRSASPAPSVTKKPRAVGERINSKDFVPPDVSGLSKREARLVKNRAAAFLSRQRKREEFECMEVRVAELAQENARLLALTQTGNATTPPNPTSDNELVSEIEQLRAQLAAAKEREHQLSAELASKNVSSDAPAIKLETSESQFSLLAPSRTPITSLHRSGAGLGLMVLLCALPTLLSMPMHSTAPTSFALPTPLPSASTTFDFNSFMPNEYDWSRTSGTSMMELDANDPGLSSSTPATAPATRKLEFMDADSNLGGLDISFDASPSENGKIRVRIHPSSSTSSRAGSPGVSLSDSKSDISSSSSSLGMWAGADLEPTLEASFSSQSYSSSTSASSYPLPLSPAGDPFLGVGASSDYGIPYSSGASSMMYGQTDDLSGDYASDFGYGSEYSAGDSTTALKRRVRIALRSMPAAGGEGGEWEVQFC